MKTFATVFAFVVAAVAGLAAHAQSQSLPPETVQAGPQSSPALFDPPASDAPIVEMARHCGHTPQRYYPQRALERGMSGRAVIDCVIAEDGSLPACQVVEETPPGWGFGHASLTLACAFRVTADTQSNGTNWIYERDGQRRLRRSIDWRLGR